MIRRLLCSAVLASVASAQCSGQTEGGDLLGELGCGACHSGLPQSNVIRERAPDLSSAGARFAPEYIFTYLLNPLPVRTNIGRSRMPDYRFSDKEALALALYLGQSRERSASATATETSELGKSQRDGEVVKSLMTARYQCLACHSMNGQGGESGQDLAAVGARLNPGWIRSFLTDPQRHMPGVAMPGHFYRIAGGTYEPVEKDSQRHRDLIVGFLSDSARAERIRLRKQFSVARVRYSEVNAELGGRIYESQKCDACHRRQEDNLAVARGPDLSEEGARVQQDWLESFLAAPWPVRPAGYPVGTGARMPDFKLSDAEIRVISTFIMDLGGRSGEGDAYSPRPISKYVMYKTERLLNEKMSCLGCHRLGKEGGLIAPDLSNVGHRLNPAYIRRVIEDPQGTVPGTVMPRIRLTPQKVDLIVSYLAYRTDSPPSEHDSDRIAAIGPNDQQPGKGATLFRKFCAACHGRQGRGDGFNARSLSPPPTALGNANLMSQRADDTLFDVIATGGRVLGVNPRMPAWGHTLEADDIWSLVNYIRTLCRCQGPRWSWDGG